MVIFKREHVLRHFGELGYKFGHETCPYTDSFFESDVQPVTRGNTMTEAGAELSSRIKSWSDTELTPCDPEAKAKGDWLFFRGSWYQCVSSVKDDNTILSHWTSEFELVSESEPALLREPPTITKGG